MAKASEAESFYAPDRKSWREWLQRYHLQRNFIWLILYRKGSGKKTILYSEAVEEALCFGWIDSKPNKRDEESFYLFFARRKPSSNWSASNKIRVEKLLEEGLIAPAGLETIAIAKANGKWDALNEIDQMILPPDLLKALKAVKGAYKNFQAFPASVKKGILEWISNAKKEETRRLRIEKTANDAGMNIRANQYVKK